MPIFHSPLIPGIYPSFNLLELLLICHYNLYLYIILHLIYLNKNFTYSGPTIHTSLHLQIS